MDIQAIIFGTDALRERMLKGDNSGETVFCLQKRGYKVAAVENEQKPKMRSQRELLLSTAKTLGVEASRCAVVENMPQGIDVAKSSGMTTIGIGAAQNYIFSDMCIRNLSELLDIFA